MVVNQSELDNFHQFATHLLAGAGRRLSLEEMMVQWQTEREHADAVAAVRRGIADCEAGKLRDLAAVDAEIRSELGFAARGQ